MNRSYRLQSRSHYLEPRPDPALHQVKCHIDSLHPTLGIVNGNDAMETFGFLATIRDAFDRHNMLEALATRTMLFFLP